MSEQSTDTAPQAPDQPIYERPSRMPDADRTAFISQLENLPSDNAPAVEQPPQAAPQTTEQAIEAGEQSAQEPIAEPAAEAAPDPLGDEQAAQKRAKFDTERTAWLEEKQAFTRELEAQKAELAERLATSEKRQAEIEAKAARAKYDPSALLSEFGVQTPEQQMAAAKQLFDMAKAAEEGAAPELKAAAERTMLAREHSDQLAAMKAEIESLRQARDTEKREIEGQKLAEQYASGLTSAAGDSTPLTRNLLNGKGKVQTQQRLLQVAAALHEQSGEVPDAIDVLKIYEESERAALQERGIDPDLVVKAAAAKTSTPEAARETATLTNDLSTTTTPRNESLSRKEQTADVLKSLMSGNLG